MYHLVFLSLFIVNNELKYWLEKKIAKKLIFHDFSLSVWRNFFPLLVNNSLSSVTTCAAAVLSQFVLLYHHTTEQADLAVCSLW